jgi:hypothetical protein
MFHEPFAYLPLHSHFEINKIKQPSQFHILVLCILGASIFNLKRRFILNSGFSPFIGFSVGVPPEIIDKSIAPSAVFQHYKTLYSLSKGRAPL